MMMKQTMLSMIMCLFVASTLAFAPADISTSITSRASKNTMPKPFLFAPTTTFTTTTTTTTTTQLQERKYMGTDDGIDKGVYLLGIVFAACAWMFTIPPEFRRAELCDANARWEGCVTTEEWTQGVSDYYKNGGGIKWDFSIDPRTKAKNQQKLDSILNNMNNNSNE